MKTAFHILSAVLLMCACTGKAGRDCSTVNSLDDLGGFTVAVSAGSSYDIMLSEKSDVDILRVGVGELLLSVEKGMADFCILDQTQAEMAHLEKRGLEIRFGEILKSTASAGFRKSDTGLCGEFDSFLSEFKESGEYDRWMSLWKENCDSMAEIAAARELPEGGRGLRVGVTNNIYPFIFVKDGRLTGIETDLMELFCIRSGMTPEFVAQEFTTLIPALNSKKIDVILSHMRVTEERAKQVLFSGPYVGGGGALICRSSNAAAVGRTGVRQRVKDSFHNNLVIENRWRLLVEGLWQTLLISLLSIVLGVLSGILLCAVRMSRNRTVAGAARIAVDIIRGLPVLILLMLMCYVVFASSRMASALIAAMSFGLYYGAYFCEIFRTGMLGVGRGQWEAGTALGLRKFQTFRLIVLPQALVRIIPVFKGDVIALIKGTSIVGYVAVMDLTRAGDLIRSRTLDAFFPLIIVTIIYFLLSRLAGRGLDALERRATPENKRQ